MPVKKHIDIDDLRYLIEERELTQKVVAQMMDIHVTQIEGRCKKYKIKTQRTGPRSGKLHPDWKGGVTIVGGYRYIYSEDHPLRTKGNYVAEHRLVMEEKIGRYLDRKEVVHHKDGNPLNNHPDNLVLFSNNASHLKHELTGKVPNWTEEGLKKMKVGAMKGYKASPLYRRTRD